VAQEVRAQLWVPYWAHEVAVELRRAPADVLVADFVLVGALVAAEAVGVPAVVLFHTIYPRPVPGRPSYGPGWAPGGGLMGRLRDATGTVIVNHLYAQDALPALNQARRRVGLRPLRGYFAQCDRTARVVVLTSPHFDYTTQRMSPNVILETFIPHTAVLPHVEVMVTQCGLGTVMKALAHGVPLVCLPLVGDQPDNAARVVARGAGLRVPADAPPERLREAIKRVVTDPAFRHTAQQLATNIAGEDPVQAAVDEIVAVTEQRPERGWGPT
jgi:glycosyltransferase involved in cell wall biosynthesis